MHKRATHVTHPAFFVLLTVNAVTTSLSVLFLQPTAAYLADDVEDAYTGGSRERAPLSGEQKESFHMATFLFKRTKQRCRRAP